MPLVLLPMKPSDTLPWTRLRLLAYAGPTHNLVHSNTPLSETSIHLAASDRKRELNKPHTWHWKIVDTDLPPNSEDAEGSEGRLIAIAVWSMKNIKSGDDEVMKEDKEIEKPPYAPPNLRLDALSSLLTPLREAQVSIMGTSSPYFMLHSLMTHPEHQGRGSAGKLLAWGLEKADDEGLVTYLDCSVMGRGLYERRGWELVRECVWDRREWGGEGEDWYGCMVRKPKSRNP